ncbi:MAG: hypothetical protein ISR99_02910 [Parcubacteria group bacterium]|nr:hypothetical protein [Parcubacteria group bacterium]
MKNLTSYLKKFSLLTPKEKTVREKFEEVLSYFSIPTGSVEIKYRSGIVYINGSGVVKNEVLINQKEIVESLNSKLDRYNIKVEKIVPGL